MQLKLALVLAVTLGFAECVLTGCGSSSKSTTAATTPGPLSGNWQMLLETTGTTGTPKTQSGFLSQNGDAITGSIQLIDDICSGVGSVTGSVSGTAISLAVNPTGLTINLTGAVGSGSTTMSGSYNILSQGCAGTAISPDSGNWIANLVSPVNGTIAGSFTSTSLSTSYAVTGSLKQGDNTGSNAPLTGTLNITGNCYFASASLVGEISGTAAVLNIVDSTGAQIGTVNAAASLDGTLLTGTYQILAGTGALANCGTGDSGTVKITL